MTLEVAAPGISAPRDLSVRLNGKTLATVGRTLAYAVDPATVKVGYNEITVALGMGATTKIKLEDLRLWIRYKRAQ